MGGLNVWGGLTGGSGSGASSIRARDLVYQAYRALGVLLRPGHQASSDAYADGLTDLNQMVDSWNTERLTVPAMQRDVMDLTADQTSFSIGDVITRPVKVVAAAIIRGSDTTSEYPIRVFSTGEYAPEPSLTVDGQFPIMNARISPPPAAGDQLVIYSWQPMQQFSDLYTTYTFPAGYVLALRLNLAVLMAPAAMTHTKVSGLLLDSIAAQAREAKARIMRVNVPSMAMRCDEALLATGAFDITRGY
jgi:hypothetical protein